MTMYQSVLIFHGTSVFFFSIILKAFFFNEKKNTQIGISSNLSKSVR